jgi:hypothetical protein
VPDRIISRQVINDLKKWQSKYLEMTITHQRLLIEKNWEYGKEFLAVFVDYKQAFDSVKKKKFGKVWQK